MFRNPLFRTLASLKLSMALLILFAVAIAKATFIENDLGAEGARDLVYNARWFEILLTLFCINMLMVLLKGIPYKPRRTGSVIVHISMIVILVSAGITRWFGYEGVMYIEEGESVDVMYSREQHLQLADEDTIATVPVRLYGPGQSLAENLSLGDKRYRVSIDEFWPNHIRVPVEADTGPRALKLRFGGEGGTIRALELNDVLEVSGLTLKYNEVMRAPVVDSSRWGDLRVHVGDEVATFPVQNELPQVMDVSGWTIAIVKFQTTYSNEAGSNFDGPMNEPAVKLEITDPDGNMGERYLFAYRPDFDSNHGGPEQDFAALDLLYTYADGTESSIDFVLGSGGDLTARSAKPLHYDDEQGHGDVPAGTVFTVGIEQAYTSQGSAMPFEVLDVFEHLGYDDASSSSDNLPDLAYITVTDPDGSEAKTILRLTRNPVTQFDLGGRAMLLKIAPIVIELPYSLYLDDFVQDNYPGSMNAASFESYVQLTDEDRGIKDRPEHIYMNHPLTHRNYKHFQSSILEDGENNQIGTILSVNYDPGKLPTYFGYILISLGFVLIFVRDLLWPRNDQDLEAKNHDA